MSNLYPLMLALLASAEEASVEEIRVLLEELHAMYETKLHEKVRTITLSAERPFSAGEVLFEAGRREGYAQASAVYLVITEYTNVLVLIQRVIEAIAAVYTLSKANGRVGDFKVFIASQRSRQRLLELMQMLATSQRKVLELLPNASIFIVGYRNLAGEMRVFLSALARVEAQGGEQSAEPLEAHLRLQQQIEDLRSALRDEGLLGGRTPDIVLKYVYDQAMQRKALHKLTDVGALQRLQRDLQQRYEEVRCWISKRPTLTPERRTALLRNEVIEVQAWEFIEGFSDLHWAAEWLRKYRSKSKKRKA